MTLFLHDVPPDVVQALFARGEPRQSDRRERLRVTADVVDSGHLPALARPDELTDWLERLAQSNG